MTYVHCSEACINEKKLKWQYSPLIDDEHIWLKIVFMLVGFKCESDVWWCINLCFSDTAFTRHQHYALDCHPDKQLCPNGQDSSIQFNVAINFHLRSSNHPSTIIPTSDKIWYETKLMVGIRVRVCHPRRGWFISLMDCTFEKGKWKFGQMFQLKLTIFPSEYSSNLIWIFGWGWIGCILFRSSNKYNSCYIHIPTKRNGKGNKLNAHNYYSAQAYKLQKHL